MSLKALSVFYRRRFFVAEIKRLGRELIGWAFALFWNLGFDLV